MERRYRACKLAGLETVDCMVKELGLGIIAEMQIIKAMLFNTKSYFGKDVLVKLEDNEEEKNNVVSSIPVSEKTMAQCTPQEQIIKIQDREAVLKYVVRIFIGNFCYRIRQNFEGCLD